MPITGRTARVCFDTFAEHIRGLVAATVTERDAILPLPTSDRMTLSFRRDRPVAAPIDTRYGRLYFYLGQALDAIPDPEHGFRLRTRQYWYRIQHAPEFNAKAALRWEYDRATAADHHARHHTQIATSVALGEGALDLNKAHVPTGWVTIEEVIRFLIVDLEMPPPCGGDQWANLLAASEAKFYSEFTGKFDDFAAEK